MIFEAIAVVQTANTAIGAVKELLNISTQKQKYKKNPVARNHLAQI